MYRENWLDLYDGPSKYAFTAAICVVAGILSIPLMAPAFATHGALFIAALVVMGCSAIISRRRKGLLRLELESIYQQRLRGKWRLGKAEMILDLLCVSLFAIGMYRQFHS